MDYETTRARRGPGNDKTGSVVALRVGNIALDCDDVLNVAQFWSAALGRPLDANSGPHSRPSEVATLSGPNQLGTSRRCLNGKRPRTGCTWT